MFPGIERKIPGKAPAFLEYEKNIRDKYDGCAVFRWDRYISLLNLLSQKKFLVLPINEMRKIHDESKVVIGLRHDVDMNPFRALEMARIEKMYGIRATYFMLATAEYSGSFGTSGYMRNEEIGILTKEIYKTGAEIGIHNDLMTVMIVHGLDPFLFNQKELLYYKSLKIPVYGTSSHGSEIARKSLPGFRIFSDFAAGDSITYQDFKYRIGRYSLRQFGFRYEAYFVGFNKYFSDAGGKWNDPDGFEGIMRQLESAVPGDRIEILIHPEWWGKTTN